MIAFDRLSRAVEDNLKGEKENGKGTWNRLGHDQQLHGGDGGRRGDGHSQQGGRAHDAFDRGVHEERRDAGRPGGEAPGGDQPEVDDLLDQALHRPPLQRDGRRDQDGPLRGRGGAERRRGGEGERQGLHRAGDLGDDPPQAEGGRGGVPGREDHRGGYHRAGLLQRPAAPGDKGRRPHRRAGREAHRQRADGGVARLRPRQEEEREDRGLRLRRRHVRHLGPGHRRRRLRGEGDERRHAPRRRRPGPGDHEVDDRRLQGRAGDRPLERHDGAPAPQGGGREGEVCALERRHLRHQPAVHHGGRDGSEAPHRDAHEAEAGDADDGSRQPHLRAVPQVHGRRSARSRTRASTPTRWWRWARRSRAAS